MPVARGPKFDLRSAAILGAVALFVVFALAIASLFLADNSGNVEVRLGTSAFQQIETERMAQTIEEQGPILFPDVSGGSRDIWLQHVGGDIADGWSAFDARPAGEPRECNVAWSVERKVFISPCDGAEYPASGDGLPEIAVFLDGRELIIDLNGVRTADEFRGYISDDDLLAELEEEETDREATVS